MFASLETKFIAAAIFLVSIVVFVLWFGAHERGIGAGKVEAKWDAAKSAQMAVVAKAAAKAQTNHDALQARFNSISATYEASTHEQAPAVAESTLSAFNAGTIQLRDDETLCPGADTAGAATVRSRELDAAATQALADRVQAAIAAIRAGDAADARERQLGAQVTGLQAVLIAERKAH